MLSLSEFISQNMGMANFLQEKLIQYNNGKKYGQIVFLAGGAGSGKGFALQKFMEKEKFKVRDIDEMKSAFLRLDALTKKYPEIRGLNLSKPEDVFKLHMFITDKGIKDKTLQLLFKDKNRDTLPNIVFDITAKDLKAITGVVPLLKKVGYDPRNIHITWILTNYEVAVKNNAGRERVVPADILLKTHIGAANTMSEIAFKNAVPRDQVDGGIYVVLNNRNNTIVYTDKDGKMLKNGKVDMHVKDFTYMQLKKPGKAPEGKADLMDQLKGWIVANTPKGLDILAALDDKEEQSKR
jgi:dephospho-CoA kinase